MLITLEGIDGAGKTTVAAALAERLGAVLLREPGGVALSERIRELVKDPALHVDPRAEALLYAAARAQLVAEQLRPRLAAGETVVLDRFVDSSLAYQGAGRGLGVEEVRRLNLFGTGGLAARPDAAAAHRPRDGAGPRRRARRRPPTGWSGRSSASSPRSPRAYDALAAAEPGRFAVIDAEQPPERRAGRLPRGGRCSVRVAVRVRPVPRPGVGDHVLERAPRGPAERARGPCAARATSAGGSPGRRASSTAGIGAPVTRRAASTTSLTV